MNSPKDTNRSTQSYTSVTTHSGRRGESLPTDSFFKLPVDVRSHTSSQAFGQTWCDHCRLAKKEELFTWGIIAYQTDREDPMATIDGCSVLENLALGEVQEKSIKEGIEWYWHPDCCDGYPCQGPIKYCEKMKRWSFTQKCVKHFPIKAPSECHPYMRGINPHRSEDSEEGTSQNELRGRVDLCPVVTAISHSTSHSDRHQNQQSVGTTPVAWTWLEPDAYCRDTMNHVKDDEQQINLDDVSMEHGEINVDRFSDMDDVFEDIRDEEMEELRKERDQARIRQAQMEERYHSEKMERKKIEIKYAKLQRRLYDDHQNYRRYLDELVKKDDTMDQKFRKQLCELELTMQMMENIARRTTI
ncbi:uncharacterized protein I206_102433 [Kwoniella pini CBS 10737]|uniref:Uncharacterized protein n=1 Tax=Kwoniella pini CBS 10737 TaxID=1296096 RepID=A0A1B9I5F3_9TREE|nr:uncharacterized protein I206_02782 [Kwoniella pini CBS 10737]OCF50726.1 hypothetical protein I206_02782 [Kwoniella pini CBS 10737]